MHSLTLTFVIQLFRLLLQPEFETFPCRRVARFSDVHSVWNLPLYSALRSFLHWSAPPLTNGVPASSTSLLRIPYFPRQEVCDGSGEFFLLLPPQVKLAKCAHWRVTVEVGDVVLIQCLKPHHPWDFQMLVSGHVPIFGNRDLLVRPTATALNWW